MSTTSKSDFAREHDVTPTTVTHWVKRGFAVVNEAGRIEREISNRKLESRPQVYRGGRLGGNAKGNPWASNGHSGGSLRTAKQWELVLIRETLGRLKEAGKKFVSEAEFAAAANEVLSEWRDDA